MSNNHHKDNELKKEEKEKPIPEKEPVKEKLITIPEEEYNQLKEASSRCADLQDSCLRLQADFDNARKRMEKQNQDFAKYATEGIILELLTIMDDLERTTQAAENKNANLDTFLKGIEMVLAHLYEMLKSHGIKPVEAQGKLFDPHTSEPLMQVASELPEHTVIEELQKGYFLHERIIRTAKVKVSNGKAQETK